MTGQVVNFCARKSAREKEVEAHHMQVDDILLRHAIVAQAIKQMQEFSGREEILTTLQFAVDVFKRHEAEP
jgi:hypothetical protein